MIKTIPLATVALFMASTASAQGIEAERCNRLLQINPNHLSASEQQAQTICMYQQSGGTATGINPGAVVVPPTPGAVYNGWGKQPLLGERP